MFRRMKAQGHNLVYQMEKELQKAQFNLIEKPLFKRFVIVICFLADLCTLYTVFKLELKQQVSMTIVSSVVAAGALDMSPVLLAMNLNIKHENNKKKWFFVFLYLIVFLGMFLETFKLRYESRYELFNIKNIYENPNEVNEDDLGQEANGGNLQNENITGAQTTCAVILGILPFATSVVCFGVTYVKDPDEKRKMRARLQKIELNHKKNEYQVMADEMKNEIENNDLEQEDELRYEAMKKQIEEYRNFLKIHVRKRLAEKTGTPQAITLLLEKDK